jgi:hypothetical protein
MFNKPLQALTNVAASSVATLHIPPEALTLTQIVFFLSGTTFDTSYISRVKVKAGARVLWDLTGAQLLAINAYKGGTANTKMLMLDFTEKKQAIFPVKEVGGLDLMALLPTGEIYVEITIGAATAPAIDAIGFFTPSQGNPFVLKYLPYSYSTSVAGKFTMPVQARGALMKRIWLPYAGTDWTSTADGNLNRLEIKKNGLVIHDMTCREARFMQAQYGKVPQSKYFVGDFIVDDNHDAHVATQRDVVSGGQKVTVYDNFEFNAYFTASDSVTPILEVLDTPNNLG